MATVERLELPGVPPTWDAAAVAEQAAQTDPAEALKAKLRGVAPALVEELTRLALHSRDDKIRLTAASKLLDLAGVAPAVREDPALAFLQRVYGPERAD